MKRRRSLSRTSRVARPAAAGMSTFLIDVRTCVEIRTMVCLSGSLMLRIAVVDYPIVVAELHKAESLEAEPLKRVT